MASMPLRKRRRFAEESKTNKGTLLAPVRVPTYEEIWILNWEVKRQALGSHRMAVGGVTEKPDPDAGEEDDDIDEDELPPTLQEVTDKKAKKRNSRFEGEEPVYYQSLKSPELWEEAINSLCIGHIVLFTAGDGACIEACLETNTSLVAFTSSPLHATLLQDRTVRYMLKKFADPKSKEYKAEYAALIEKKDQDPKSKAAKAAKKKGGDGAKAGAKKGAKPKGSAKKGKGAKKKKPEEEVEEGEDDDEEEEEEEDDDEEEEEDEEAGGESGYSE